MSEPPQDMEPDAPNDDDERDVHPREQAAEYCRQIIFNVALARKSGSPAERANMLIQASLSYPAVADHQRGLIRGWLDELDALAAEAGDDGVRAVVAAKRAMLFLREEKVGEARAALDAVVEPTEKVRRDVFRIARFLVGVAEGKGSERQELDEIVASADPVTVALALHARAAWSERFEAGSAAAAWREALARTPGVLLDARLYALGRLIELDETDRPFLIRLVAEIGVATGNAQAVLDLAGRHPTLMDPVVLQEARDLAASVALGMSTPREGAPKPPEEPAMGLVEKIGCATLIVGAVALGAMVIWFKCC